MANINTSKSVGKPKPKPAPKPVAKKPVYKPVYKPAPPKKAPASKSKAVYKDHHKPAPKPVAKPKPKPVVKPKPKPVVKPKPKPVPVKKTPASKMKDVYKDQHKPVAKPKPKVVTKPVPPKKVPVGKMKDLYKETTKAPPPKAPVGKMKDIYKDQHKPVVKPKPVPKGKLKDIYKDHNKPIKPPAKAPVGKMKDIYADQHKPVKPPAKAPVGKMKDIYADLHKPVVKPVVKPTPQKVAPKGKMEDIYKDHHKPVTKAPVKPVVKAPTKPTTGGTAPKPSTGSKLPTVALPKPPVATKPSTGVKPVVPKPTTPVAPKPTAPKPTAPKPTTPAPPPKPVTDQWGTVGPTNNGKANWNSNQSIPNYGSMTPEMIKNIEAGYMNGGKQYDPATDPVYQSMLQTANKQAASAGLASMEEMNARGILNSTVTSDRNQQIQQGASDSVIAAIPGLAQNYQNQQSNSQAGYLSLLQTVMGGAENQQEFAEGNRRFDKEYQLDEADVTGTYNSAEAIAQGQAKNSFGIQTLEKQGQLADQKLATDKLTFDRDAYRQDLAFKKDSFSQDMKFKKDSFNREMNYTEQQSMIDADLKSRGLDLEAVKIGTDRFMAESDADYKQRQIDSNVTEVQASTNTNKAIGNILGVDSLSEGFAFIESQTNSWASSGVDIRSVIDALESKFPGSKEALASSGGGGTSSYFGP